MTEIPSDDTEARIETPMFDAIADVFDALEPTQPAEAPEGRGENARADLETATNDLIPRPRCNERKSMMADDTEARVADLVDACEQLQSALRDQDFPTVQVSDCMGLVRDALDAIDPQPERTD